jgi:hypothetical protein
VVTKEERQEKKTLTNERNRRKRLEFARACVNKPIDFWKTVLVIDDSKFNVFGSDGPRYVWRKGKNAIVEGIMNAKGYVNILRGNLKKSVRKLGIQDSYLFQQDNDPKYTALITREWLLYDARGLLETPAQLQIENLWSLLEKN